MSTKEFTATEIPWMDSSKWKKGFWYPLPIGFMSRDQKEYIIEGYGIFTLMSDEEQIHPEAFDIEPPKDLPQEFIDNAMLFSHALAMCELKNGVKLL